MSNSLESLDIENLTEAEKFRMAELEHFERAKKEAQWEVFGLATRRLEENMGSLSKREASLLQAMLRQQVEQMEGEKATREPPAEYKEAA